MITSNFQKLYVWVWLPDEINPVVAGLIEKQTNEISFLYAQSYLTRKNAICISPGELPLVSGWQFPKPGLQMANAIRDAAPDAWGRRVIVNRLGGKINADRSLLDFDEFVYLIESASDRIGALDFQLAPDHYIAREEAAASLEELQMAAHHVSQGIPLTPELQRALFHGTSIGGARPKAMIEDQSQKYIAKFSSSSDIFDVIKLEYVAMQLAQVVGIRAANTKLAKSANKSVLLIERFDRHSVQDGWTRKHMLSALTLLELDEMMARYASYQDLAEIIRLKFSAPRETLQELFSRLIFNVLCGNNDDHARNHAAFWDGEVFELTPAYDICPQARSGGECTQAMKILGDDRRSQIATCLDACEFFALDRRTALEIIGGIRHHICNSWDTVCKTAELSEVEKNYFWGRQFLNAYAFERLSPSELKVIEG